ncbi:TonB-dependent receptor [Dyella monticola]|uniref:TonB-dependent receptor n=1 Tax=Dyella monticola TaxID=1927958 RepID=A0A370WSI5_9GAMM|nr:TonB-dependent receptor plug domain-containing protein [Dyella monticola]RDS79063.1 TonB-dependent receptor [Dyella monticola]
MSNKKVVSVSNRMPVRHTALAVAVAIGFGFSGHVLAQATTGTIFGQAPVASGETVQVVGGSGFNRTIPVDKSGRYSVTLPVGSYTVTLIQNGQSIQTKQNVTALAAKAVAVDFVAAGGANASNTQNLSSVMVTANAIPPIDVTSTQESTVITSEQLKNLPLARTGAAIALLAPGTVQGSTNLGNGPTGEPLVSFGGSSVAENAYYINGFNTSDPIANEGGITLPYGAIAQQETLTNGYGPEYGRSTGGVISQVGASGTNTWHFGGAVFWQPQDVQGTQQNLYFDNPSIPSQIGSQYQYRNKNTSWQQIYDAYVGGPLIKDKLFFFLAAEADRTSTDTVGPTTQPNAYTNHYSNPKYYAKVDWNITDSNILSFTDIKNTYQYNGNIYDYDYDNHSVTGYQGPNTSQKNSFNIWIGKFTSYITDDLTLNAMIGKMDGHYFTAIPGVGSSDDPAITNQQFENPAFCAALNCVTNQTYATVNNPAHRSEETNLRFDLTYKLGDHTLQVGIDNQTSRDIEDGSSTTGPGYYWEYGTVQNPSAPLEGSPYVGPPGSNYYVSKVVYNTSATVQVTQRAQYIKDTWQATPNLLLNLGLRNDTFVNDNAQGVAYINETKPQWAPRLGFSWDILGDSTMKLFGNAGRYYLAIPSGVAVREAAASLYTNQWYTYSGMTSTGIPTGLTPIYSCGQGGVCGPGVPTSANNEFGQTLDPSTIAAQNLKPEYQDSYVLGFQHQFAPNWDYGVTVTRTKLGRIIDDTAEGPSTICQIVTEENPQLGPYTGTCNLDVNGSLLINPGNTNDFKIINPAGGYVYGSVSPSQLGFPRAYRNYYSLETFLEHTWDGKWTAKLDYVYSKSYGTTEGPTDSGIGQGGTSQSITEQWDFSQLMQYSNGLQSNSRKHVLKGYGTYQFLPEWSISAVVTLASGTPIECLGYYGPAQTDPIGYAIYSSGAYHWCGGNPAPSGSTGFTPWIHTLDLALQYRPLWAEKKLAFQLQVRNITNEQKVTQYDGEYGLSAAPNPLYRTPTIQADGIAAMEAPRTVQLGVTYDW